MTPEQQVHVIIGALGQYVDEYLAETLSRVVRFVIGRSHNGYVDFSVEDFINSLFDLNEEENNK